MALDDELRALNRAYNDYVDGSVVGVVSVIKNILGRAVDRTIGRLSGRLTSKGPIGRTKAEVRTLNQVNTLLLREAELQGLSPALEAWTGSWGYQAKFLNETFDLLGLGRVSLTAEQTSALAAQQAAGVGMIGAEVEAMASSAKRDVLAQIGQIDQGDMISLIRQRVTKDTKEVEAIADTAITTFYRSMNASATETIEASKGALLYRYFGPADKLRRPFCVRVMNAQRSYTRAEIDAMDNGQLPEVFLTCGGYRCRHQWIVDTTKGPFNV